ncbi:MAG: hypothetical protein E6Q92_02810 [Burkholderiaceae bacterium]|nr:MAG: hypothetical protein E6Q92_02810 [Burkholderiaceae bacterium]
MNRTPAARLLALATALVLSACGGGGGGSGTGAGGSTPAPTPTPPTSKPLAAALVSGDPSALAAADQPDILTQAIQEATGLKQRQLAAVASIVDPSVTDFSFKLGTNSSDITASKNTLSVPLVVADDGSHLASIALVGNGRGLAYGANVLSWMAGSTTEQQHQPFFRRAFTWLVAGQGGATLPTTLKVAAAGYDGNVVKAYGAKVGVTVTVQTCKIDDPANTCWRDAELLVFGSGTADSAGLTALVRSYLDAGKPVMYMHPSWVESVGGRKVLSAMGMTLGGYPGNYFAGTAGVSVGAARTRDDVLAKADSFGALISTLNLLQRNDLKVDFSADTTALAPINALHTALGDLQSRGVDVFKDPDAQLYRLLVLWADIQRRSVTYGGTLSSKGDSNAFLRAYASDSWLLFNRSATTVPPQGAGDYMPAVAATLPVSTSDETLTVTIPQTGGITLIGRGAVPGKPVTLSVVDAAGAASLSVQTSHVRTWGNPVSDATYARPRRPHSFSIPLATTGATTTFVTPFGGPLMLNYSGATAGTVITLKLRGTTKYAHFDFTQNPSQAELDEAVAALKRADFGWQTNKLVGGEIQQTIGYAKSAIGNLDPKTYVVDRIKGILFDSNHFANGYNNMPMSAGAQQLCTDLGWTCDGAMHRAPNVQHFVGWIATCGYLCSGNPSDGFAGIDTGWGWAHELGHNTVQRVMHIAPNGKGCVVECDNNILASATMLRQASVNGIDTGHNLDHKGLYQMVLANRGTGLTGEALRADMETRLWGGDSQDPMRAVHFQLAFLYTQLRQGKAQPDMTGTLEFFQLLTKADRLVDKAWDAANKGKYGMGRFADNKIANEDLLYVLSSKIIGRDLRAQFAMYGIPLTQTALDSVADLGLPAQPLGYYALPVGKHNQLATGQWVSLQGQSPAYPY